MYNDDPLWQRRPHTRTSQVTKVTHTQTLSTTYYLLCEQLKLKLTRAFASQLLRNNPGPTHITTHDAGHPPTPRLHTNTHRTPPVMASGQMIRKNPASRGTKNRQSDWRVVSSEPRRRFKRSRRSNGRRRRARGRCQCRWRVRVRRRGSLPRRIPSSGARGARGGTQGAGA